MNKTAQFTPGPWYVHSNKIAVGDRDNDRHIIADIRGMEAFGNPTPDATLIAAAPAMYEALAKLRLEAIHYRNTGVGKQFLNEAIAQAEQAINQVWGEGNHDTKREG